MGQQRDDRGLQPLLRDPKSLVLAVPRWLDADTDEDDEDRERASGWLTSGDDVVMRIHPVIQMWRGYVDYGTMPRSGGWEDQPLPLLVTFAVLSFAESTWRNYRQENFNWSKFSRTQLDFITWAEKELALG